LECKDITFIKHANLFFIFFHFNPLNSTLLMMDHKKNIIISWYNKNQRPLPWRQTKDAYRIWLSEIILQQTRVQQGLPYYQNFIKHFPDIHSLARAEEDSILHLWQGLGYYSRARNMHAAAKTIVSEYKGKFPSSYDDIRRLKGVGEYTAAAIASFAFGLSYAAIDGNVIRVITRLFGIEEDISQNSTRKKISAIAQEMMGKSNPALFNQSMMEFGALQCKAGLPDCNVCPLNDDCFAKMNNKVVHLPFKAKKTKVRNRFFNYIIIKTQDNSIYIRKRTEKDIWQNLYDFPLIESSQAISDIALLDKIHQHEFCKSPIDISYRSKEIKHKLSHQLLHIQFNILNCAPTKIRDKWIKIPIAKFENFAFPEIINKNKSLFF